MVCTKCQKQPRTTLVTPGVKRKSEIYFGSSATSSSSSASGSGAGSDKKSATLGQNGISKSKLLSKGAKNPYAQYSSSCVKCKTKVSQGHTYCHQCAYKDDKCAICGKANKKTAGSGPVVSGQKFSLK